MRTYTLIALFGAASAVRTMDEPTSTLPETVATPVDLSDPTYHVDGTDWVGKYQVNGGSTNFINAVASMDTLYGDGDGVTTWGEMKGYMDRLGLEVDDQHKNQADDYAWHDDANLISDVFTELHTQGDARVSEDAATDILELFGADAATAQNIWDQQATLPMSVIQREVQNMINRRSQQFTSTSADFNRWLQLMDASQDGVVTLSEFIDQLNSMRQGFLKPLIDKQAFIDRVGVSYAWNQDINLITDILTSGFDDLSTYSGAYDLFAALSVPHYVDIELQEKTQRGKYGIGREDVSAFWSFVQNAGDKNWASRPEGWLPLPQRPQTYWTSDAFKQWYDDNLSAEDTADFNFKQVLQELNNNGNYALDVDSVAAVHGEGMDWMDVKNDVFGLILASGFSDDGAVTTPWTTRSDGKLLTYEQVYRLISEVISPTRPWIVDIYDAGALVGQGITVEQLTRLIDEWMYSDDALWTSDDRPDNWIPYDNRIIPNYPYEPTDEQVKAYANEQLDKAQAIIDKYRMAVSAAVDLEAHIYFNSEGDLLTYIGELFKHIDDSYNPVIPH